ncbi:hypothetical protein [Hwangdonia sp.]|uniref:hypothetical protein n=1 Tax=Hwangdonia sp. TaxID=1883432 RepID=UPI003AB160A5
MNKGCKTTFIVILIILGVFLIGGYFAIKTLGKAFGPDCDKTESWAIQEYEIIKYSCLGWAGPRYYPLYLYKNGKELPSTGFKIDSCLISFNPQINLHIKFDICENRIERFEPMKKNILLSSIDSATIFSNHLKESKKLAKEKVKSFVTEWNASNPRGFRENKDSIFYSDFQYKISVYENGKEIEFRTFNYLINDSTNWVYTLEDQKNEAFFDNLWKE